LFRYNKARGRHLYPPTKKKRVHFLNKARGRHLYPPTKKKRVHFLTVTPFVCPPKGKRGMAQIKLLG
jgi:hypothetical protein